MSPTKFEEILAAAAGAGFREFRPGHPSSAELPSSGRVRLRPREPWLSVDKAGGGVILEQRRRSRAHVEETSGTRGHFSPSSPRRCKNLADDPAPPATQYT